MIITSLLKRGGDNILIERVINRGRVTEMLLCRYFKGHIMH